MSSNFEEQPQPGSRPPGHAGDVPTETRATASPRPPALQRIGQYHVKRVIASGGMGTVYEATQEHPRRAVALKLMRQGIASRSALRRFEYESQILARLRHPGIAQVYDAGTHRDDSGTVPYFAMEYIPNARPITRYAHEKQLTIRDRLQLFAQVCDAVHHGHQKGIIHRDLKPANILVDSQGQPKIIDFGVARSTDSDMAVTTLQTDVGQIIGTLQYMSPEQCEADPHDLDVRSDVYALGVLLYELLCGKVPYDVTRITMFEATRVIREQRPARLSTINRTLRGDIETIVLKALEKERERRYQSAADLATDIRHYLNNEPISARPPSLTYQLRIFARRHKAGFAAIAAVFVVLVVGVIVSTSLYLRAESAREQAEARRAEAEVVSGFLNHTLASVDPAKALGHEVTVKEMLDQAAAGFENRFRGMPLAEANLHLTIGNTYRALSRYSEAEPHLRAALKLRRQRLGNENLDVAEALADLGVLLDCKGEYDEAETLWRKALDIRRKLLGNDHPLVAESRNKLGVFSFRTGDYAHAESLWREVLEYRRKHFGEQNADVARSLNNVAAALQSQGKYADAEAPYEESLRIRRKLFGDVHPAVAESLNNLGTLLLDLGKHAAAADMLRETLDVYRKLHGAEHTDIARCLSNLASATFGTGDLEDAQRFARQAVDMQRRLVGSGNTETGQYLAILGEVQVARGELVEAESVLREALTILRGAYPADNPDVAITQSVLGDCLALQGRSDEAEPLLLSSYGILVKAYGDKDPDTIEARERLARYYDGLGQSDKAKAYRTELSRAQPP